METSARNHSRRQFIKGAGLVGAASLISSPAATGQQTVQSSGGQAKNIIFLVADGNGAGTLGLAHHWKLRQSGMPLNWTQLLQRADLRLCLQDTASASSPVTDSAAAATAWGSGQRVNNGSINYSTKGEPLKPIMRYAKEAGLATGLVTTCRITHATPAGFASNSSKRGDERRILDCYYNNEIDVLLGGGSRMFKSVNPDSFLADYFEAFTAKGYTLTRSKTALKKARKASKLLGIFSSSHIPYAIDRKYGPGHASVPSLTEMFEAALASLEEAPKGFLLQVEAGRVDHAGHANDAAAILHETLEFDNTIELATKYIADHPDTLLIVTSDHGTGGCQLNGWGPSYVDSGPALDRVNGIKGSFEALESHFKKSGRFDADYFTEMTGLVVSSDQAAQVQKLIDENVKYLSSAMTDLFEDALLELTAVGWTSNNHTSECVELLAFGPGSEQIPFFVKNYEMFQVMRHSLGI